MKLDSGISINDPRLTDLHFFGPTISQEDMLKVIEKNEFFRRILEGKLVLPNFPKISHLLDGFYEKVIFLL